MKLGTIGAIAASAMLSFTAFADTRKTGPAGHAKAPATAEACATARGTWDATANAGKGKCTLAATTKKSGTTTAPKDPHAAAPAGGEAPPAQ